MDDHNFLPIKFIGVIFDAKLYLVNFILFEMRILKIIS